MKFSILYNRNSWLLFLLSFYFSTLYAQKPNTDMQHYTKEWAAIDKFEYDGQPQSALKASQELYDKILKDKTNPAQTAQRIKGLLYITRLVSQGMVALGEIPRKSRSVLSMAVKHGLRTEMNRQFLPLHVVDTHR